MSPRMRRARSIACMCGTMPSGIFSPVYGCVISSCLRSCHSDRIFLREAAAARSVFVQEADRGVEADALKRRLGVVREQRVDEG